MLAFYITFQLLFLLLIQRERKEKRKENEILPFQSKFKRPIEKIGRTDKSDILLANGLL